MSNAQLGSVADTLNVPTPRTASLLLGLSMFSTGAAGLVAEYVLATVSTYILGNSVEQFSIVIGLMLFMMGVAAWVQKHFSDRGLITKFMLIEAALAVLVSIAPIAIYWAHGTMTAHYNLVHYFFVMTIGFLIGFEIPLIMRINKTYEEELKVNVSTVLSLDYLGGLVGALVWAWVLLRFFPLTEIAPIVAGFNFVVAAITVGYFMYVGLVRRPRVVSVVSLGVVGVVAFMGLRGPEIGLKLEQRFYEDPVVLQKTTRYQHLVVTHNKELNDWRLYINGNVQFSSTDEAIYHEQLVHPIMHMARNRDSVLVMGGGDGMAVREVLKYDDVNQIQLVDLDPEMTRLFRENPVLKRLNSGALLDARVQRKVAASVKAGGWRSVDYETRGYDSLGRPHTEKVADVRVMNIDADRFLENVEGQWNVIVLDFPDPNSVELAKLYSLEFYQKLKNHLAPDGLIVLQSTSPYHAKEAFLAIRRTLEAAGLETLPYHDNVPSFGEWGWILATRDRRAPVLESRANRLDSLTVATDYLTPEVFQASRVFGKEALSGRPENRDKINTLMEPVLLDLYLRAGWKLE